MQGRPNAATPPVSRGQAARQDQAARRDPVAWRLAEVPAAGDLAAAEAFCRAVARRHYENFTVATRLVPPRLRQHLANVYAKLGIAGRAQLAPALGLVDAATAVPAARSGRDR